MFKSLALSAVMLSATALPAAAGLSYAYRYPLALETDLSVEALTESVAHNFALFFPFDSNCVELPPIGGRCDLYAFPGLSNPVQVIDRTDNSWTFLSLPGHTEGAGRTTVFSFERATTGMELRIRAGGPYTPTAAAAIHSGAAYATWYLFANNVSTVY
ncbi:hypothetical protein JOD54_002691 [Actinokineospora baliensis]|uniref:hypothetical protein n=1 Tax=Actinokineospora baliensis TaxID=547056 RepID=UPI00195629E1|nr:hypothetical protein [Actinokineospora baliensis]MBM7772487.1 hypothetical protein [Actinokineospora baliensis]